MISDPLRGPEIRKKSEILWLERDKKADICKNYDIMYKLFVRFNANCEIF